jgi:hypothetical protein
MATTSEVAVLVIGIGIMLGLVIFAIRFLRQTRSALRPVMSLKDWAAAEGLVQNPDGSYEGLWRGYTVHLHLETRGSGKHQSSWWVASAQLEPHPRLRPILSTFHQLTIDSDGWIHHPTWSSGQVAGELFDDPAKVWHALNTEDAYGGPLDHHARDALATVIERARFADRALGRDVPEVAGHAGWEGDLDGDGRLDESD